MMMLLSTSTTIKHLVELELFITQEKMLAVRISPVQLYCQTHKPIQYILHLNHRMQLIVMLNQFITQLVMVLMNIGKLHLMGSTQFTQ